MCFMYNATIWRYSVNHTNETFEQREFYFTQREQRDPNWREQWSNSNNLFAKISYNIINDAFVTLQPLSDPFIGAIRENEFTGGRAFLNIDGTTNYKGIESAVNTFSMVMTYVGTAGAGLEVAVPKGLGYIKPLNASRFSSTFKGSLSGLNPATRGFLNRGLNKGILYWNKEVTTGNFLFDLTSIYNIK